MKIAQKILIPLLMLLASVSVFSKPQTFSLPEEAMEGMFNLQYRHLINTQIICVVMNDSIYVPMKEIFTRLMIYYTFDSDKQIFEGYYISPKNPYRIELNSGLAEVAGEEIRLRSDEFIRDDLEIYILPQTLRRMFGLLIDADFSSLMVVVNDNMDDLLTKEFDALLPILQKYNRSRQHDRLEESSESNPLFPLLYDRDQHLLNGGIMGTNLNFGMNSMSKALSYGTNLGAELLGGDVTANLFGVFNNGFDYQNFNFRNFLNWRYYFGDNPVLTTFRVGNINSASGRLSSVNSMPLTGASITNAPVNFSTLYTDDYVLEDDIPIGWQVEFFVNGVLTDFQSSSANSRKYRFVFPVRYGRTHVELRFYGPKGENYTEESVIDIPYYIMKPLEVNYSLAAGFPNFTNFSSFNQPKVFDGKLGLGLTRFMSLYAGVTKYEDIKDPLYMGRLFVSLSSDLEMIITADQNAFLSVATFLSTDNFGNYVLNYTDFRVLTNAFSKENLGSILFTTDFTANMPQVDLFVPVSFSLKWARRQFAPQPGLLISSNNTTMRLGIFLESFKVIANYNLSFVESNFAFSDITQTINPSLTYIWFEKPYFIDFLKTTAFTIGGFYDITRNQLRTVYGGITQSIGDNINLGIRYDHDLLSRTEQYNVGLAMNLESFRSNSSAIFFGKDYQFNQSLDFGVAYDSFSNDLFVQNLYASNLTAGTGGAVLRFYLDDNGNEIYEEGEQILPDVQADISGGKRVIDKDLRLSRYFGLMAYGTYYVRLDKDAFTNPLWVANSPSFSFMVDPNQLKTIDIACYSTGVIEGAISKVEGDKTTPQPGVKVHILKKDSTFEETLPVFSDGSFYKAGIPPGEYTAWVDSAQIAILNVKPVPEIIAFQVAKTTYGDFVEGLNFDLYTQEAYLAKAENGNSLRKIDDSRLRNGNNHDSAAVLNANSADGSGIDAQSPSPSGADIPSGTDINAPAAAVVLGSEATPDDGLKVADTYTPSADEKAAALLVVPAAKPNTKSTIQIITNETKLFSYKNSKDFKLTSQMTAYLDAVAEFMTNNPRCELSIVAHTDNFGSMKETQDISDKRASAVVAYLSAKGIAEGRLLARGEGSRAPIASNLTDPGRLQNRRIEIMVIE